MQRADKSPYCGIALVVALAAGVSFWAGLIWVVVRMIR
jgi:hypothetical protein